MFGNACARSVRVNDEHRAAFSPGQLAMKRPWATFDLRSLVRLHKDVAAQNPSAHP